MATQTFTAQGFEQAVRRHTISAAERNSTLFAAQQRSRRGPTPEVFFSKHLDNARLVKAADPQRTREMRSFAFAMAALFVLVMIYMGQHFSAIEYGYRIETAGTWCHDRPVPRCPAPDVTVGEAWGKDCRSVQMCHQRQLLAHVATCGTSATDRPSLPMGREGRKRQAPERRSGCAGPV